MSSTALGGRLSAGASPARAIPRIRLDSVDLLRGLVMVLMALDHVRDYFTDLRFNPTAIDRTTVPLFFTRWVTHFCAPTFVLLAGTSGYLAGYRGRSRGQLARLLVTRGLWLVLLEFTVIQFGWSFNVDYGGLLWVQVIWVIGVSMIALAGLIYLPLPAITAVGAVIIAGHNLFDAVAPQQVGVWGPLWTLLHVQGPIRLPAGNVLFVAYPLIPWIGVMALGYALGPVLRRPEADRRRALLRIGAALTAGFLVLRGINGYGDPSRWSSQPSMVSTVLSFLNTTKYPSSLLFLLMTLGPAIASLAWFERLRGPVARFLIVFGRVPLFYYVLHIYLVHGAAMLVAVLAGFPATSFLVPPFTMPDGWGYGLPVVYLVWLTVVLALYPVCRWFADLKARRREVWLSYL